MTEFIFAFGRKYKDEIIIIFNNTQKIFKVKKEVQNRKNKWSCQKKVEPSKDDIKK